MIFTFRIRSNVKETFVSISPDAWLVASCFAQLFGKQGLLPSKLYIHPHSIPLDHYHAPPTTPINASLTC